MTSREPSGRAVPGPEAGNRGGDLGKTEARLHATYDALVLAPHLDDGTLSCGGQIHELSSRGQSVLVATLFAGAPPADVPLTPLARQMHARWGLEAGDAIALRREEDARACTILGAHWIHGPALDAIYRVGPEGDGRPLRESPSDLRGRPRRADLALVDSLVAWLRDLPQAGRVFAPLGVGRHVDHRLTRLAAERVWGDRLSYYEDYPYARGRRSRLRAVAARWRWSCDVVPVSDAALQAKVSAIAAYSSQLASVADDLAAVERGVREYARQVGGERLWRKRGQRAPAAAR